MPRKHLKTTFPYYALMREHCATDSNYIFNLQWFELYLVLETKKNFSYHLKIYSRNLCLGKIFPQGRKYLHCKNMIGAGV